VEAGRQRHAPAAQACTRRRTDELDRKDGALAHDGDVGVRRGQQRVGRHVLGLRHPPRARAVQHAPLERHSRQQAVEGALPVRGDDDDAVAAVICVADLALSRRRRRLSFGHRTSGARLTHHALPRQPEVRLGHAAAQRALDRSLQRRVGSARRLHQAAGRETRRHAAREERAGVKPRAKRRSVERMRRAQQQARAPPRRVRRCLNKSHLLHCAARLQPRWRPRTATRRARACEPAARAPSADACAGGAERPQQLCSIAHVPTPAAARGRSRLGSARRIARPLLFLFEVCWSPPPKGGPASSVDAVRYNERTFWLGLLNHARRPAAVIPCTARVSRRLRSWRAVQTRVRQRPRSSALRLLADERRGVCRGACAARRPAQGARGSLYTRASARSLHASQIFIAAGEPSGDVLAARVMAALRAAAPCAVDFCGVGGCVRLPSRSFGCASLTAAQQAAHATGALAAGVPRGRLGGHGCAHRVTPRCNTDTAPTALVRAGVFELLPHLPRLALRLHTASEAVRAWKPHCVLTVDYKVRPVASCAVPALPLD